LHREATSAGRARDHQQSDVEKVTHLRARLAALDGHRLPAPDRLG
jgi:hypothetical protein